jgi:hypothetical protein
MIYYDQLWFMCLPCRKERRAGNLQEMLWSHIQMKTFKFKISQKLILTRSEFAMVISLHGTSLLITELFTRFHWHIYVRPLYDYVSFGKTRQTHGYTLPCTPMLSKYWIRNAFKQLIIVSTNKNWYEIKRSCVIQYICINYRRLRNSGHHDYF